MPPVSYTHLDVYKRQTQIQELVCHALRLAVSCGVVGESGGCSVFEHNVPVQQTGQLYRQLNMFGVILNIEFYFIRNFFPFANFIVLRNRHNRDERTKNVIRQQFRQNIQSKYLKFTLCHSTQFGEFITFSLFYSFSFSVYSQSS